MATENFFDSFDVVHTITRQDLIDEGALIDVSHHGRLAGYLVDCAITPGVLDVLEGKGASLVVRLMSLMTLARRTMQPWGARCAQPGVKYEFTYMSSPMYAVLDTVGGLIGVTILLQGED